MDNAAIAAALDLAASLLEQAGANPFRVRAYRNGAATVRSLRRPVTEMLAEGGKVGLERLPAIGPRLACVVSKLARTGRWRLLDELRAGTAPEQVLAALPGVGRGLAERIHERLGTSTLLELEAAANDGRLEAVEGVGPARAARIREAVQAVRGRRPTPVAGPPPIGELLSVDREYRQEAAAGRLYKIAPRRYNPRGEAWLPILYTRRDGRRYTAVFSNTAAAHKLRKTGDWVVLYYGEPHGEGQATVVTAEDGELAGRRAVRGREEETKQYYEHQGLAVP